MSRREPSLVWRATGLILGGAGLVLLTVLIVSHVMQRGRLIEQQLAHSNALALSAVNQIATQLGKTETAVQTTATAWTLLPGDQNSTSALIEKIMKDQSLLLGMAVALPEAERSRGFRILYGFRKNGTVQVSERPKPDLDLQEDWFRIPYELKRPVWSEPYLDKAVGVRMITYSVPVLQEGRVLAVVTGDLALSRLRNLLDHLPLVEGSTAILISSKGIYVSHPDVRRELHESVFSEAKAMPTPEAAAELTDLGRTMLSNQAGYRFFKGVEDSDRAYINYQPVSSIGWALGVVVPERRILDPLVSQTRTSLLIGAGGLILLFIAAWMLASSLAAPLRRLALTAQQLAGGQFDTPLPPVGRRDELGRLTESFGKMRTDLRGYIDRLTLATAAREKIASELAIAHQIQLDMVPHQFPPLPKPEGLDLYACLEPAREVGGDLYDFALLDPDHLYVAMGDVSGKGVPASLLMAVGKTLLKSTIQALRDPARALVLVNQELAEHNDGCMFITAFCGVLNLRTGDFTFANAGHNPPLVARADGSVETLCAKPGPALAAMLGSHYLSHSIRLAGKDTLLLYTDGVTEAMDPNNKMFEEQRLLEILHGGLPSTMRALVENIVSSVHNHAAGTEQSDDITLLALRVDSYPEAFSCPPSRVADAELALHNRREELSLLVTWIEAFADKNALPPSLVVNLNLALEEWFVNVVTYAFPNDGLEHQVVFRLWLEASLLRIEVEDDGRPFDPTAHAIPDTAAGLEHRQLGGLGIHFIRRVMSGMSYRRQNEHNFLTLTTRLTDPSSLNPS